MFETNFRALPEVKKPSVTKNIKKQHENQPDVN